MEGVGRARTAALHVTTDGVPVVLVGDLDVKDSWLNAPCQLSSVIERFGSGLVCCTGSKMRSAWEGKGRTVTSVH